MHIQAIEETVNATPTRMVHRCLFTKKLERRLEEKEIAVPQQVVGLMDIPFDCFRQDEQEVYETQMKPLTPVLMENLTEIYEAMGRPRKGWEHLLDLIKQSPIKVLATMVIQEQDRLQEVEEEPAPVEEEALVMPMAQEKFKVTTYATRQADNNRWWAKKIF
jgi:hypothetical protein